MDNLNAIPAATVDGWARREMLANQKGCFTHPNLLAEFWYLDKRTQYWTDFVRLERQMRSKFRLAVTYQCLATFDVRADFRNWYFAMLTSFWRRIEVLRGCYAEDPPVVSHNMGELVDKNSEWWVVGDTEWIDRVLAFLLF